MTGSVARVLLVGGGHSHVEVLRRFARKPDPDIELTLVSPGATTPYSGMLPGTIAGHYTNEQASIALGPLTHWAGARFVRGEVVALDLHTRTVKLAAGGFRAFDLVSLDVGSSPAMTVPGAKEHTLGVKPVEPFLAAWESMRADAATAGVRALICMIPVPSLIRSVSGARYASGAIVSMPHASALHAYSTPSRSAAFTSSTTSFQFEPS